MIRPGLPDALLRLLLPGALSLLAGFQETVPAPLEDAVPTREQVAAALARAETSSLDPELAARVVDSYRQALQSLDEAASWDERRVRFEEEAQEAPALVAAIQAVLAQEPEPQVVPAGLSLSELEQGAATARAQLDAATLAVTELEAEAARRSERRVALPELLATAQALAGEVEAQLRLEVAPEQPPEAAAARRTRLLARWKALTSEIRSHEREIATADARRELLTARRNQAARNVRTWGPQVKDWQDAADRVRLAEAERRRREADEKVEEAGELHPVLAERAQRGAELAAEREELAVRIEQLGLESTRARERLRNLETRFSDARRKLDAAGLTDAIGRLLRQERIELFATRAIRSDLRSRQREVARVQFRLIELENLRSALQDGDARVEELLAAVEGSEALDRAAIESSAREILAAELELTEDLLDDYQKCFGDLVSLDTDERQVLELSDEFAQFINEHVLWVRSSTPIWQSPASGMATALLWVLEPESWAGVGRALRSDVVHQSSLYGFAAVLLVALLLVRHRVDRRLREVGERASRATEQSIRPTLAAAALTLVGSVPAASVLAFLGWRLDATAAGDEFVQGLATGLYRGAFLLLLLLLLARTVRPSGLGESHFGWTEATTGLVRRQVRWLLSLVVPLEVLVHHLAFREAVPWSDAVARLAFLVQTGAFCVFLHRVLHRRRGVVRGGSGAAGDWMARFAGWWHLLGVAGPAALGGLALLGFFFTARELAFRFQLTAGFLFALLILQGIALRWVLVVRRRLAIAQARERRAAEQVAAREAGEDVPERIVAEEVRDAASLSQEIRKLARTVIGFAAILGMWLIWVDVLPALWIFRDVELWDRTVQVSRTYTDSDGAQRIEMLESVVPVSLADLLLVLLILFALVIANRNLPALLEVALLRRMPLLPGERYAVTTLVRYAITIVGLVLAFEQIGIGWSKVQWLAAGISVGLGFGLQEIFANFVSGLTLLFERPIRVGDWVTVGDIEGAVTRIRIRATTIVDRDLKELVVPNREFVTGQLINWTLSDPVTRVVVPVGIAYGSDVELAEQTLLRIGRTCPLALAEPPPNAVFLGFGSSSLDFELRVFVQGREILPRVQHDLHKRIDREFRAAGIVIAFPQRDLHFKSADRPLVDALREATRRSSPPPAGGRGTAEES